MENEYGFPNFNNVEFWENEVRRYITQNFEPGDFQSGLLVGLIWEYFKYQWKNQSNYYFEHPLVDEIIRKFSENVFVLKKDEKVFRARNFNDEKLYDETKRYFRVKNISRSIESMKESGMPEQKLQESIEYIKEINKYSDETKNKIESGFIGYDADGSTAPPIGMVAGGRCNMPGIAYLYTAGDPHTAIVEIRPRFCDNVSVATLLANRDLKLVDFYYNYNEKSLIIDKLFDSICSEFSKISKGDDNDYLVTRYIIDLIKWEQYDGIRFKSSLVSDGMNFVLFNPNDCRAISSNLYQIQDIRYQYDDVVKDETF